MHKFAKSILGVFIGITSFVAISTFMVSDPLPDFSQQGISLDDQIPLIEINTKNSEKIPLKAR